MKSMAVTYLVSEYPAVSHTFIYREIQSLREMGHHIICVSVRRPAQLNVLTEAEQQEAGRTHYLKEKLWRAPWSLLKRLTTRPRSTLSMLAAAWRVGQLKAVAYVLEACLLLDVVERHGSPHIHVHFANAAATVAWIAAQSGLCEYSLSIHGPDVFDNVSRNLLAEKVRDARFIRCISHYCRSQVQRWLPATHWHKVHIVRCGINPDVFAPSTKSATDTPEVLCVGRLCSAKAQFMLLQASKRLADKGVKHRLTLVGDGPDRLDLEELARSLQITGHAEFTGAASQEKVREYYDRADVFVLPSFAEGVPVVLMEAMAKEIPVVSSRITGIPELVDHDRNGLLSAPTDLDGLTQHIERLLTEPSLRTTLGKQARETVVAQYNLSVNCQKLGETMARYVLQ